jgi:hypothetical protein
MRASRRPYGTAIEWHERRQRDAMLTAASSTFSAAANAPSATTTATAANQSDQRNFMMLPPRDTVVHISLDV